MFPWGTFQEVPTLTDVELSGGQWAMRTCAGGEKRKKSLGSGSMRETDLTWKEHRRAGDAKPSGSTADLVSARLRGPSLGRTGQLVSTAGLGRVLPVLQPQFPTLITGGGGLLSLPFRVKSFIDLLSQIRTVEEATHRRDKVVSVRFSLFCDEVLPQFQEIQYIPT